MKKPYKETFTSQDRNRLRRALRGTDNLHAFRRIQAVLGVAEGNTKKDMAHLLAVTPRSVSLWCERYLRRRRIEDLHDADGRGRPLAASVVTPFKILRELTYDPLRLGYASTVWTVSLLAHRLSKKYRCTINPRTLRRRMKEAGLVWKRPRYVFHERAPHIAQKKEHSSEE